MIPPLHRDPERDRRLGAALRRAESAADGAPASADGDAALVARIVRAAGPSLAARRRGTRPWWEWTAAWARFAVPAAAAAMLAFGYVALGPRTDTGPAVVGEAALVLGGDIASGEAVAATVVAPADGEWLWAEAIDR